MRPDKELWRTRLNDVPSSAPITYVVNGRQYVALVTGNGGAQAATFPGAGAGDQEPAGSRRDVVGVRAAHGSTRGQPESVNAGEGRVYLRR